MDVIIGFFKTHMINVFIAGGILFLIKLLIAILHKGFSFTKVFLSFFTFYDKIEIESIGNRKRASFMWWNNVLNYSFYFWVLLVAFILFVTYNSNQF